MPTVMMIDDRGRIVPLLRQMHDRRLTILIAEQLQKWLGLGPDRVSLRRNSVPSDAVWRPQSDFRPA
jgi:hypothetical protein